MQTFRLLLILLSLITSAVADDDSVLAIEIRQMRTHSLGKPPKLTTVCLGSGVVIDSGVNKEGKQGYLLLTAAHVVMDGITDKSNGLYKPTLYQVPTVYEVCVKKQWYPAYFEMYSLEGDLAILTFLCNEKIPLSCLADRRALKRERLKANGYVNGNDQKELDGRCKGEADYPAESVAPNCDIFYGLRESFSEGVSGGGVFDSEGNLAGIISARNGVKPGYGLYTHVGEIRRFLSAGWDGSYDQAPAVEQVPMPDRAIPREIGDEPEPEPTLAE